MIRTILIVSFLLYLIPTFAQNQETRVIEGEVYESEYGEAIIGATIYIKNTIQGTITDIEGKFSLEIPSNENVDLIVSYGCPSLEIRTKLNRSYYRIDISKFITVNRLHTSGGKLDFRENKFVSNPLIEIGLLQERHIGILRYVNLVTGLSYRYEVLTQRNEGLGVLLVPLNLKRRLRSIYLQGGVTINQVIHSNFENNQRLKRFLSMNVLIGWNLTNRLDIALGGNYYYIREQRNSELISRINTAISVNYVIK